MKLPRGVSSDRLIRVLEPFGYKVMRKKCSHVRLRHGASPTKTGALHGTLSEIARMRSLPIEDLAELL